ncbi:hypothetical protein NUSPORA_01091 [Nucleospora cyclopteri]
MKKYLVVGAGGTGSEILKILCSSNSAITVIDYDKIEISNLCRQFYYSENDVNEFKAEIIAKRLHVNYKVCYIDEIDAGYFDQFDVIFSCVDNLTARMQINYLFRLSKCQMMIDMGVEGLKMHVKKVTKESACLYCIKDLFNTNNLPFLCSLSGKIAVTELNREKMLKSTVLSHKNGKTAEEIVEIFNNSVNNDRYKTNLFEVKGIYEEIVPNVSFINSICASFAILMIYDQDHDYLFYNGEQKVYLSKQNIEKDEECIVCKLNKD